MAVRREERTRDPEAITVRLGRRVHALRDAAGLSQDELARACRISRVYIGSLERGDQAATIEILERLACGLQVALVDLLDEDKAPKLDAREQALRDLAHRVVAYGADASEDDLRRFERLARAFFGLSVAAKAADGRPKIRKTGFERRKPQPKRKRS